MPSISVVIPTYNGSMYILKTIESVLKQTCKDYEIIVVDDGSEEDIEGLLKPFANMISYIHLQNSGPAAARNTGIRASRGEFIALLDHDDVWEPDNLQGKVDILRGNPECAMIYSYPELIDCEGNRIPQEYPSVFPSGSVFEDFLQRNWITTFSCTLIRKSIFGVVGFLDERREVTCCDDYDMWLRIADVSCIKFFPDSSVNYRIHANNLFKNHDMSMNSHILIYKKALKESRTVERLPINKLSRIVRDHMYNLYHQYAFKYYYDRNHYIKTSELLWRCILLKPFVFIVWKYFLICLLPSVCVDKLRLANMKFNTK